MLKKKAVKKKTTKKKTLKKKVVKKKSVKRPGLYANIHAARKRAAAGGKPVRKKGEKGAPTDAAFEKSKRTAKRKSR